MVLGARVAEFDTAVAWLLRATPTSPLIALCGDLTSRDARQILWVLDNFDSVVAFGRERHCVAFVLS